MKNENLFKLASKRGKKTLSKKVKNVVENKNEKDNDDIIFIAGEIYAKQHFVYAHMLIIYDGVKKEFLFECYKDLNLKSPNVTIEVKQNEVLDFIKDIHERMEKFV